MLIKVNKTKKAASCPLGIKVKEYLAGQVYDIHEDLAKVFLDENWGIEFKAKQAEKKAVNSAPENKAFKTEKSENKKVKTKSTKKNK